MTDALSALDEMFGEDPTNVRKLDAALRPYVHHGKSIGRMLRHPLVYQVPFYSWKLANDQYTVKRAYLEQLLAHPTPDWHAALWLYERPHRLPTLAQWHRDDARLSAKALRALLAAAWVDGEFTSAQAELAAYLFRAANAGQRHPVCDTKGRVLPPGRVVTVYRGQRTSDALGWSWSLQYGVAEWFARRWGQGQHSTVVECRVQRRHVLGLFTSRGEHEVVFDPAHCITDSIIHHPLITPGAPND